VALDTVVLERVGRKVAERLGLRFPRERWRDPSQIATDAAAALHFDDVEVFAEWLTTAGPSDEQWRTIGDHFTAAVTHFFREPRAFEALVEHFVPHALQRGRRPVRIWSAGCCTGEEAYSLAMAIRHAFPGLAARDVDILATDVNTAAVDAARAARYGPSSFAGTHACVTRRFCRPTADGDHRIVESVRRMVRFERHNLVGSPFPTDVDVIFCRNVLMYFDDAAQHTVVDGFDGALAPGGFLIVGSAEPATPALRSLVAQRLNGMTFFRPSAFRGPEMAATGRLTAYDRARTAFDAGAHGEAASLLEPLLLRADGSGRVPALMAELRFAQLDFQAARSFCLQALAVQQQYPPYLYLLTRILRSLGEFGPARCILDHLLQLDPTHVMAHFDLALVAEQQSRPADAARHRRRARALLDGYDDDAEIPGSDGILAGRLVTAIDALA